VTFYLFFSDPKERKYPTIVRCFLQPNKAFARKVIEEIQDPTFSQV
jgi:hypothetical protein